MFSVRKFASVSLIAITAAIAAYYVFVPSKILIPGDVKGMESSSKSMYGIGPDQTQTALGQVFKVPPKHPILTDASFLARFPTYDRRPASSPGVTQKMRIKLRVSEWNGQQIVGSPLFESAVLELKKVENHPKFEWITFPTNKLRLTPGKFYLAWITGVDLSNEPYDSFGIVNMGTRGQAGGSGRVSMYPDGYMVIWDKDTMDGSISKMHQEPWKPEAYRASLHFKMNFRSH